MGVLLFTCVLYRLAFCIGRICTDHTYIHLIRRCSDVAKMPHGHASRPAGMAVVRNGVGTGQVSAGGPPSPGLESAWGHGGGEWTWTILRGISCRHFRETMPSSANLDLGYLDWVYNAMPEGPRNHEAHESRGLGGLGAYKGDPRGKPALLAPPGTPRLRAPARGVVLFVLHAYLATFPERARVVGMLRARRRRRQTTAASPRSRRHGEEQTRGMSPMQMCVFPGAEPGPLATPAMERSLTSSQPSISNVGMRCSFCICILSRN